MNKKNMHKKDMNMRDMNMRDKKQVMSMFPTIELSYEKKLHKKVLTSNLYLGIPKGPKYFIWFTNYKGINKCFLLKLKNRKIINVNIKNYCFDNNLCLGCGTVVYGTLFNTNNINKFSIEDIYYYKGISVKFYKMIDKLNIFNQMLSKLIKPFFFNKYDFILMLPIMSTTYDDCIKKVKKCGYTVYAIQQRLLYKNRVYLNELWTDTVVNIKELEFLVKPSITNDIYNLYCLDTEEKTNKLIGTALIMSYKTSVLMNKLFRNIKENNNLDLLEESDDEEEFENISDDKYVDMTKQFVMTCIYNKKFKLWEPKNVSEKSCCVYSEYLKF